MDTEKDENEYGDQLEQRVKNDKDSGGEIDGVMKMPGLVQTRQKLEKMATGSKKVEKDH